MGYNFFMVDVQFEQPDTTSFNTARFVVKEKASMVGWLIKRGVAPNEKIANLILVGVVIGLIVLSIFLIIKSMGDQADPLTEKQKKSAEINRPHATQ